MFNNGKRQYKLENEVVFIFLIVLPYPRSYYLYFLITSENMRDYFQRDMILKFLANLSVPVAHKKLEGSHIKLVFLGIDLIAATLSSHQLDDKVQDIRSSLRGILAPVLFPIANSPP